MQIVISISDIDYDLITQKQPHELSEEYIERLFMKIEDGTVLPEHHGRLIDADALWRKWVFDAIGKQEIDEAPTIIEATKEKELSCDTCKYKDKKFPCIDCLEKDRYEENGRMREATKEERESINNYIESISQKVRNRNMVVMKMTHMEHIPKYCDDCTYYGCKPHPYKGWSDSCELCMQCMDDDQDEGWIYDGNGRPKNCPLMEIKAESEDKT